MHDTINPVSLDTLCGALCEIMGIEPPCHAGKADTRVTEYASKVFGGEKADRVLMFNPDAVAQWLFEKYPQLVSEVNRIAELKVPYATVMPSVTPVCFGTMYTGAKPQVHGIMKYEKPVIKIETIFDALIKAGKKPVILAETGFSMAKIFLERDMDYFIYDTIEEINAKATEIIMEDKYDFIAIYNGNYDHMMHEFGPESLEALSALRLNSQNYAFLTTLVSRYWTNHNTLTAFAMDHGCHEIDGGAGSHGLYMEEDINIMHSFKAFPKGK